MKTRTLTACAWAIYCGTLLQGSVQGQVPRPNAQPRPAANGQPAPVPRPAANGTVPRPAQVAVAPAAAPVDPKLDALLLAWERNSAQIKTLQGKHERRRGNTVFGTESVSEGAYYFEAPDKGRIDIKGIVPNKNAVAMMKDADGKPFSLEADRSEKWICTGREVLMIDDEQKQFQVFPLPPEMQGVNIIDSPLPFLFGMKAAEAKARFDLRLVREDVEQQKALLVAIPKHAKDAQNFREAQIYLDTRLYVPALVRLFDPAGTVVTRYDFKIDQMNINSKSLGNVLKGIFGQGNPFQPSMSGYKLVQPPPTANTAPTKTSSTIQPAGNTTQNPGSATTRPANSTFAPRPTNGVSPTGGPVPRPR